MKAARWGVVAVAGAVLSWAFVEAWRAAWAGPDWIAAKGELATWRGNALPPKESWQKGWEWLQRARDLEPGNPKIHEFMGLYAARKTDDYAILQEATTHHLRSVSLRPISPVTWVNIAEARYLVGDTAKLFETAIENAVRLGPSEPNVQVKAAYYGLAVLDEVKPSTRSAIEVAVAAGVRRDPAQFLAIGELPGRLDVACRYLPETRRKVDPRWGPLCERAAKR